MSTETTFESKVIKGRSNNDVMCRKFILELQTAIQEGWTFDPAAVGVYSRPVFSRSLVRVPLIKPVVAAQRNLLEDPKSSKPELLEYAASLGIEVPKDKASPAAIKKFIKDSLEAKTEEDKKLDSDPDENKEDLDKQSDETNQDNA